MKNKILVIWPPENYVMLIHSKIPKRWAYLAEIVSYLKKNYPSFEFEVIDCLNPKYSFGEILSLISKNEYLCVIFVSRIEGIESTKEIISKIKSIKPYQKIIYLFFIMTYLIFISFLFCKAFLDPFDY